MATLKARKGSKVPDSARSKSKSPGLPGEKSFLQSGMRGGLLQTVVNKMKDVVREREETIRKIYDENKALQGELGKGRTRYNELLKALEEEEFGSHQLSAEINSLA